MDGSKGGLSIINQEMIIILQRLTVIILLSGLIGFEREIKNHPAGLRTHILVGTGSCLLMLLSLYGFEHFISSYENGIIKVDPGRIPSYVISGIGFLGAGTIIVQGGGSVKGLTTAASIWLVAGIGLVIGAGMFFAGTVTTGIVLFTLFFLNKLEKKLDRKDEKTLLTIMTEQQEDTFTKIKAYLDEQEIEILNTEIEETTPHKNKKQFKYQFSIYMSQLDKNPGVIDKIHNLSYVNKVLIQ
ncbi:MgtC/SapB family protein [Bacillus sp. AK128]